MKFDYQETLSSLPQPLTQMRFLELTRSELVNRAVVDFQAGDKAAKKRLPAAMFQASFGGKRRSNANAIPSGLYMLDLDHLEGETAKIAEGFMAKVKECGIMLIHTTPSGHGLRVVAKMQKEQGFKTIREFQIWLAAQLGFKAEEVDTAMGDMARMSFIPPFSYIHYLDNAMFSMDAEYTVNPSENTPAPLPKLSPSASSDTPPAAPASTNVQQDYMGIPLKDIARRLIENLFDVEIAEGNRNASLYKLARVFRYVCDFSAEAMAAAMPHYGLEHAEVLQLCRSACDTFRRTNWPDELVSTIEEIKSERTADADDDDEAPDLEKSVSLSLSDYQRELPPLPPLFRDYVRICPQDFKAVQLVSMLPVVGALCTGIRAVYLDGNEQSPSFLTVVTAPQASGKSFARNMYQSLTEKMKAEDDANRAIEEAYRQELKRAKNAKEQPEDPRAVIRLLPPSVSIAKLLQRLDYAQGKHLLTFAEEIDTLTKSNKSGAWAQKSDIYRNAFDNAAYGQDYMSDASYSTVVNVYYNLLILGTPRAVGRFFKDVEDGLVSRVLFAEIPSQAGKRMPHFQRFSASVQKHNSQLVDALSASEDFFELDYLNKAIECWLEQRRLDFLRTQNMALEIFRRRAAVIGFRAGMVAVACYKADAKEDDGNLARYRRRIKAFALWVANYALTALLSRYGSEMQEVTSRDGCGSTSVYYVDVFSRLAETFTIDELRSVIKKYNIKTPPKMVVYRWKQNELIEPAEMKGVYRKLKTKQETNN